MDGKYKKDFWNYFDYIGRRTNNDLEAFNRQLNRFLRSPKPNIFKFVQHIQGVDQSVSLQIMFIDEDGNLDPVNVLEDVVEDFNNSIVEDLENVDLNTNILDNSTYLQMREEEHEADI